MIHPSIFLFKTCKFLSQEHVALLKLQHVATQNFSFFFILILSPFFKKIKIKNLRVARQMGVVSVTPILAIGGGRTTPKTGLKPPPWLKWRWPANPCGSKG